MRKLLPTVLLLLLFWQTGCTEPEPLPTQSAVYNTVPVVQTATPAPSYYYIGNQNTYKFHRSSCSFLPMEKNRVYFSSKEEALERYFDPCMKCHP